MEGLTNPDKLEALWEQSKAKKLWDDSHKSLDQYLSQPHPAEDSVSIKDYMSRWCNVVQTPNSPTPQEDHRMPQTSSSAKRDNLDKYDKFINELSIRIEGGWPLEDHIPHDEDLLRHTLGLTPRVKQDKEVYPISVQDRLTPQPDSDKRTDSDKNSTFTDTIKGELQSSNQRER